MKAPEPKYPLFTSDFFSTKSFGPGHLFGAAVLAGTLYGTIKYLVHRSRDEQARGYPPPVPGWATNPPVTSPAMATVADTRGRYR